jgi:hypothetical protein
MSCKEIKTKKYQTRKSPPFHAKDCKNQIKKGKDGEYISKPDAKGTYKWQKHTKTRSKKMAGLKHKYETQDNGGKPFIVEDFGSKVIVYKQEFNLDADAYDPPVELFTQTYKEIFVGDKPKWQDPVNWRPEYKGNSILLRLSAGKYMFIGHEIFEFETVSGDEIEKYVSEMGNNGVPYPFAVGKTHVYIMLDHESVPKDYFELDKDVYHQYYLPIWLNDCKYQKAAKKTDLCKRWKAGDQNLKDQLDYLEKNRKKFKVKMVQKRLL